VRLRATIFVRPERAQHLNIGQFRRVCRAHRLSDLPLAHQLAEEFDRFFLVSDEVVDAEGPAEGGDQEIHLVSHVISRSFKPIAKLRGCVTILVGGSFFSGVGGYHGVLGFLKELSYGPSPAGTSSGIAVPAEP